MTPGLQVRDLRVYYGTPRGIVRAVDGVSFDLRPGEALGLVGESGAGKSSLALALMRLLPRNVVTFEGAVLLDGADCRNLSEESFRTQVRWRRLSMVFQGAMESLNPVLRVGQQVAEAALEEPGIPRREAYIRAAELLERVLLPREVLERYPHELSGGMKQRVLIAMALVRRPRVVILDEPTSALDVSVQAQIMNLLKRLKQEMELATLFITHDIALASDLCDTLALMYGGQLVELGPAERVLLEPHHPYTQLLLQAVPRLRGREEPASIPGSPPDMALPPPGCRFHPRCPYAFQRCSQETPPLFQPAPDHQARCWLREQAGE